MNGCYVAFMLNTLILCFELRPIIYCFIVMNKDLNMLLYSYELRPYLLEITFTALKSRTNTSTNMTFSLYNPVVGELQ